MPVRFTPPTFDKVNVIAALVVPLTTLPKASEVGEIAAIA
jgi:hypothetical protein